MLNSCCVEEMRVSSGFGLCSTWRDFSSHQIPRISPKHEPGNETSGHGMHPNYVSVLETA